MSLMSLKKSYFLVFLLNSWEEIPHGQENKLKLCAVNELTLDLKHSLEK